MMKSEIVEKLTKVIQSNPGFNAPYGVLVSDHPRYTSITFGRARTLDCEVRVYGPNFILFRPSNRSPEVVRTPEEALAIIAAL